MSEPDYTPEFEDVVRMAIEQRLFDLNTCLPGIVESYDAQTQTVSVKPALMRKYNERLVELPLLQKVPVELPRAGAWSISGPIEKGDTGLLRFAQRSLDAWKLKGGVVDPNDPRKFHITDAVFTPGVGPFAKSIKNTSKHLRLQNGKALIELQASGKFRLEQTGGDELLDLLVQITSKLELVTKTLGTTTVNTQLGPQPLLDAALFASTEAEITELKAKLSELKG